jgi:hypothetical protein
VNGPTARLQTWGGLPERYAHRRVAASTIDAAGRMVFLLVDPDVTCAEQGHPPEPYAATAVVIDGGDIIVEVVIPNLDLGFPRSTSWMTASCCGAAVALRTGKARAFEEGGSGCAKGWML